MEPGGPSSTRNDSFDADQALGELPLVFRQGGLPQEDAIFAAPLVIPDATKAMVSYDIYTFTEDELDAYTNHFANRLGGGGHSNVFRGLVRGRPERILNGLPIAVKVSHRMSGNSMQQWTAEKENIPRFNHKNIIQLLGSGQSNTSLYLIYPLMEKGSLADNLKGLNWKQTIKIIKGVTLALRQVHCYKWLVFVDLKPGNILLDKNYRPKISDFGLIRQEGQTLPNGTWGYTDQETMLGKPAYRSSDIWSLGIVMLQLIMKSEIIYHTISPNGSMIKDWAAEDYWMNDHAVHNRLMKDCTKKKATAITRLGLECTKMKAEERPTVDHVLEVILEIKGNNLKKLVKLG